MTLRMPARGDRSAPSFDPTKPRGLKHYFSELEYLFADADVTQELDMKRYAIRYVSYEVADIWETLPAFADASKTFADFKEAVEALYPDADEDYKYTLADLDLLIGSRHRTGMNSLADLADYHSQFLAVTTFLISKGRLSEIEQKRAFVRGFADDIWTRISQRLQLKFLDHLPDEPYNVSDVQAAARFVLHGTHASSTHIPITSSTTTAATPSAPSSIIKPEQLGSLFTEFTKSIVEALNSAQNRPRQPAASSTSSSGPLRCAFCGKEHFIRNCELVEEYHRAGKLKRNIEGKVVLPSGAFVPRDIPGNLLKERIDEWHRRNPGQLATASLSASTMLHTIATVPTSVNNGSMPSGSQPVYQFSTEDRIALLEAELFNLRAQRPGFTPLIRTRAQKAKAPIPEEDKDLSNSEAPKDRTQQPDTSGSPPPNKSLPKDSNTPIPSRETPYIEEEPEHPFRDALDASYIPPQPRNVAAPYRPPPKRSEPAYRNQAPIYDEKLLKTILDRSLDASITLTQRELLSIAPEVRNQYKDVTSAKRTQANFLEGNDQQQRIFNVSVPKSTPLPAGIHRSPPDGATVIPDPYEQYYRSLRPGEVPDPSRLSVAKESAALCSIFPIIDNSLRIESILDPGSQIIAMSEEMCHELSLVYDPTIRLNMQSANGTVDQSLGLARNVPFRIGELVFYMQVHIIRAPAYDILLGRPFDILTASVVRNFQNEDQTITVTDPNTGQTATIPTLPRRSPHARRCLNTDFRGPRI